MNLLDDALISVGLHDGSVEARTLPGVLADLSTDRVRSFPGLRPHQRTAWHSLLVLLGALCCHRQGAQSPAESSTGWRQWLLALTPDWPNGEAWALVNSNVLQPAFLQAPEPSGSLKGFKEVTCADDLDVLATSKNHDVKQSSMSIAAAEQWIFALVCLQTQQGFLGAGNYGISRMNGGFSNRAFFGVRPHGGPGRWFQRDVGVLLNRRDFVLRDYPAYPSHGGLSLVWTVPWDGTSSLRLVDLDLWYVEICRRVRLVRSATDRLIALVAGSKVSRIDTRGLSGRTGDPWAPLVADGSEFKVLTTQPHTFSYRALVPLLFSSPQESATVRRAEMQIVSPSDDEDNLSVMVSALIRGQGKTEGFYERTIPVSRLARVGLIHAPTDRISEIARERVAEAGVMSRDVLYPAALAIFTGAPSQNERKRDDDMTKARARAVSDEFERMVDDDFFQALNSEIELMGDESHRATIRTEWLRVLGERARQVLVNAMNRAPDSAARHYRTRAKSLSVFEDRLRRHFAIQLTSPSSQAASQPNEPEEVTA